MVKKKRYLVDAYATRDDKTIYGIFDSETKSPYWLGAFNYDALLKIADLLNEKSYRIEQLKKENEAQSDAIDSLQELLAHIDLEEMNIL